MSLSEIQKRINSAETEFSKPIGSTKLIAVSKVQPIERVKFVLDQGHRVFGENRVQEAQSKWPEFKEQYQNVELHIIGPLQTNKTRAAMELANTIHTVDRLKLAKNIARVARHRHARSSFQVKTDEEKQKLGDTCRNGALLQNV